MNYLFIFIGVIFVIYVINLIRKKTFSVTESFFWVCAALVTLIFSIFPKILDWIAIKIGIDYPPSLLFIISIMFLLFISFRCSRKISVLNEKITYLAQDLSTIKSNKKGEKNEN